MLGHKYNFLFLFIFYTLLYFIIGYITHEVILNDSFYHSVLSDTLSPSRLDRYLIQKKQLKPLAYTLIPVFLLIKWFFISCAIYIAALFFNQTAPFRAYFKAAAYSEIVFIIGGIVKIIYFTINPPTTFEQLRDFMPLSMAQLITTSSNFYVIYPLQQLNLFEAAYILLMTLILKHRFKIGFSTILKPVSFGYGSLLLVWMLLVIFLQLQFS